MLSLGAVALQAEDAAEAVDAAETVAWTAGRVALAVAVVYLLGRYLFVPAVVRAVEARNRHNRTLVAAIRRYARAFVLLVAVAAGVVVAGYGSALVGSGVVVAALTLAVGIAGQEVIGNLVSGLFLVADPRFNVGDYIRWDENEGVVESIELRVTRVRTPDNETVTVPNTELTTTTVTAPYAGRRYRVTEDVTVGYDADLPEAVELLERAAADVPGVLAAPSPRARFVRFGDDGPLLRVAYWVADPVREAVADARLGFAEQVVARAAEADLELSPAAGRELSGNVRVRRDDADER